MLNNLFGVKTLLRPVTHPRFKFGLMVVVAALFVLVGQGLIVQRTVTLVPIGYGDVGPDARAYISMTEGNLSSTPSPYKYRILVPSLARLLPLAAKDSLVTVSFVSLFAFYLLVLLTCAKLGIHMLASVAGLLAVFTTGWHLYHYTNPFLTDAFALMTLSLMLFALVRGSFPLFAAAAILGVLARETPIFLVPVWFLTQNRPKGAVLCLVAVIVLFVPRYVLSSGSGLAEISAAFNYVALRLGPVRLGTGIVLSWGFTWVLALIGLWLIPRDKFPPLVIAFGFLGLGALLSSIIAADTGRMFSILAPVAAVACAQLYATLLQRREYMPLLTFTALIIMRAFDSVPNVIFDQSSWVQDNRMVTLALLGAGLASGLYVAFVLRKLLLEEVRQKWAGIRNRLPAT